MCSILHSHILCLKETLQELHDNATLYLPRTFFSRWMAADVPKECLIVVLHRQDWISRSCHKTSHGGSQVILSSHFGWFYSSLCFQQESQTSWTHTAKTAICYTFQAGTFISCLPLSATLSSNWILSHQISASSLRADLSPIRTLFQSPSWISDPLKIAMFWESTLNIL